MDYQKLYQSTRDTWNKFLCLILGHWEHRMNPVVKFGQTDAAGGRDVTRYTPVYCVRCDKQWREENNA